MRIRSLDPEVYLVEVEFAGKAHRVVNDKGESLLFRGQVAAKKPFAGLSIRRAVLCHQSAYDEMVGQPPSSNAVEMPTSLPEPD